MAQVLTFWGPQLSKPHPPCAASYAIVQQMVLTPYCGNLPSPVTTVRSYASEAEALKDLYRLWFSWPSVYRITYWNLVDFTCHLESLSSGFYRRDMTKKPVYHVLDNLLNKEWKTRLAVTAAKDGRIAFRGFRGRYRLSWMGKDGKTASRFVDVQ